jgi:D-glycero-alpha-D-manno-heptose-7-phosphate kinase
MTATEKTLRMINSIAPIRICDNGGWTDTWFAEHGCIFNIGVSPHAEVQIEVYPRDSRADQITLFVENYGEHYTVQRSTDTWDRHPLLEAAIAYVGVPDDIAVNITLYSDAPAGASIGTSASVTVALVGALDRLTPGQLTPHEVAYAAQIIETKLLKRQCGIQDQLCAAYGGINYIDMHQYPHASVSQIHLSNAVWWELNRRLVLIYLGSSHDSSQVHEQVIRGLEGAGAECEPLKRLRTTARRSRDAVYAGDWAALGQAMRDNTEMQRELHPALISDDAQHLIEVAKANGALGWKVNGAGGEGGSITLLCGDSTAQQRAMLRAITAANPLYQQIPIHLSRYGLYVWET